MARKVIKARQESGGIESLSTARVPAQSTLEHANIDFPPGLPRVVIPAGTILRRAVKKILDAQALHPELRTQWKQFKHLHDWKQYHSLHPEWQGQSMKDLSKERNTLECKFVEAFVNWVERVAGEDSERKEKLIRRIFPNYRAMRDWSGLKTIKAWKEEFLRHPEWNGKYLEQVKSEVNEGGRAFVNAFLRWAKKKSGADSKKRTKLINALFPNYQERADWSKITTIGDWQKALSQVPAWQGLSIGQIANCKTENGNSVLLWHF